MSVCVTSFFCYYGHNITVWALLSVCERSYFEAVLRERQEILEIIVSFLSLVNTFFSCSVHSNLFTEEIPQMSIERFQILLLLLSKWNLLPSNSWYRTWNPLFVFTSSHESFICSEVSGIIYNQGHENIIFHVRSSFINLYQFWQTSLIAGNWHIISSFTSRKWLRILY